jgi:hypothetical protein
MMGSEPTVVEKQDGLLFFQPFPENKLQYYFASEEIARLGNVRCTVYYYSGTLPLKGQYHEIFDPLIFFNKGTVARDFRPSVFFQSINPTNGPDSRAKAVSHMASKSVSTGLMTPLKLKIKYRIPQPFFV